MLNGRLEGSLSGINKGMEGYIRKINSLPRYVNKLSVWDIDDTLFRSDLKILVIKNNQVVKALSTVEFNTYKKKSGEEFDFSQFKDGKLFFHSANPLESNLKIAKNALEASDTMMITLSARSKTTDKNLFLKKFQKYGINMNLAKSHSVFAGDLSLPTAKAKASVIDKCLESKKFNSIFMYDDNKQNINEFLKLQTKYKNVDFHAYLVDHRTGKITKVK